MNVGDLVNYTNRNGKLLFGIVTCFVPDNTVLVSLTDEIKMGSMWLNAEFLEVISE